MVVVAKDFKKQMKQFPNIKPGEEFSGYD